VLPNLPKHWWVSRRFAKAIIAVDLFKDFGKGFKFTNIKGKEVELITSHCLRWGKNDKNGKDKMFFLRPQS